MLHPVTMGRDFGKEVEILTGIEAGQKIILNPPDSLRSDEPVKVSQENDKSGPEGGKQQNATGGTH
jgi:hypothetical protein